MRAAEGGLLERAGLEVTISVPGGEEMRRHVADFNDEGTKAGLLPGTLDKIETNPPDRPRIRWSNRWGNSLSLNLRVCFSISFLRLSVVAEK